MIETLIGAGLGIFIGVAILLGFLFFYRRKRSGSRQAFRALAEKLHGRVTGKSLFSGDLMEGLHGGIPFTCRYFMGSKNAPPSLTIQIKTPCPARLTIRKEAWYDRFAKQIGLVDEIRTGDPSFDKAYFFDTDRGDLFLSYLADPSRRQKIDQLFTLSLPVREIVFDKKKGVRIVLSPFRGDNFASVPADQYLDGLVSLSVGLAEAGLPLSYGPSLFPDAPRPPVSSAGLVLIFSLLGILILGGAVSLGVGLSEYEPLGNRLILNALAVSAPAALVFLYLVFRWIRGRSSSHRFFLFVLILSLAGFPLALTGGAVVTNGYLDQGTETTREVPVTDRYVTKSKESLTYYLAFPSWQHPGETDRLSVTADVFRTVRPGDRIVVRTKPGFWQEEWIAGIERAAAGSPQSETAATLPIRLLGIRFYEGGTTSIPMDDRRYASEFPRDSSRYIWCQVDMENGLWQDTNRLYTFRWQYLNPDGNLRGEAELPFTVRKDWRTAWVSHSWGWDEPGQWPGGRYRVVILVDGKPFGEGTFTIR
ncbi:MAG TPA: hypothetical protein PLO63_00055 [Syntrophales bacterium]|nr:hypothetical protein [Syntrophales bacterium]